MRSGIIGKDSDFQRNEQGQLALLRVVEKSAGFVKKKRLTFRCEK
jgi:hypothetical protein